MSQMNRVGVLGGGQLARMLVIEGFKMGLEMHVLSLHANDPAAQVTRFWHEGDPNNEQHVANLLSHVDVATVESEFLDSDLLARASRSSKVEIAPSPALLGELSDRKTQKEWLVDHKLPTSPFVAFNGTPDVHIFFRDHERSGGIVIKKRRHGYDGYGTFVIRSPRDLDKWLHKFDGQVPDFIGEAFVPFRRELALQLARNAKGEILCYPLVEWQAQNSRCLWVKGPLCPSATAEKLARRAARALEEAKYLGLISFELFELEPSHRAAKNSARNESLIINELAPRVHNSGHYSLDATALNQFQAHLRAILNWPLPKKPEFATNGFAMWNWLGQAQGDGHLSPDRQPPSDVHVHWYGKSEVREGRKMGHLTALGVTPDAALKKLKSAAKRMKI